MIIVFCGHSDYIQNAQDEIKILNILEGEVGDAPCEILLGGYGNFDAFAFACARKFKRCHTAVKLTLVVPYLKKSKQIYPKEEFDSVVYPSLESVPPRYAITRRNRWMIEQADIVVSYVSRQYGGAYTMYLNAKRKGKKTYNIGSLK